VSVAEERRSLTDGAERPFEFGRSYANYALGVLLGVSIFNLTDRAIIAFLLVPIAQELDLSDGQLGIIAGPAFGIFYALAQIPIARFADRGSRVNVIALALAFWSAMTALQSFAAGFLTLALARAAVALGEAGSGPASQSMLSDTFPPSQRTRAFAVLAFQAPIGAALGALAGGWGREYLGWRGALLLVAIPGLLFALLTWRTLKEPTRGYFNPRVQERTASLAETIRFLFSLRSARHLVIGYTVWVTVAAAGTFDPVFLERSFQLKSSQIGSLVGIAGMLAMVGYFLGGWLADRLAMRDPAWVMRLPPIFLMLHLVVSATYYLAPNTTVLIAMLLIGPFLPGTLPLILATMQNLAPPHMRARATALLLTISTLVGMSVGPPLVGTISDWLEPSLGIESMRYALLSVVATGWIWTAAHYWIGARTLTRDLQAQHRV
jgi:MFS family permease